MIRANKTLEYAQIRANTRTYSHEYVGISGNTRGYERIRGDMNDYEGIHRNTREYTGIHGNTREGIRRNARNTHEYEKIRQKT